MDAVSIKTYWDEVLTNKKITKVLYDRLGLCGFLLDDGIKVEYDHMGKGLFIINDPKTMEPIKYN